MNWFSKLFSPKIEKVEAEEILVPDENPIVHVTRYSQSIKFQTLNQQEAYDRVRKFMGQGGLRGVGNFDFQSLDGLGLSPSVIEGIYQCAVYDYQRILLKGIWHGLEKQTYYKSDLNETTTDNCPIR